MADNNDFLSQFSGEGKPAKKPESFQEEVRVAVKKPKKEIKPVQIIIPAAIVAVVAAVLVIIFVLPHIAVEDFTGKTQTDVAKWATQYGIDKSGIIFNEEYSLDYDDGIIISQDPSSGKVTKKAKMTFVISKGPDPDEKVTLPDLENMTKSEIQAWIDENHLLSTKISTVYDDAVPEGNVIKVDYTNIDKDNFTRGTTLKITCSKGEQPANQITVKDYTNKLYSELESWAKTNSITLEKTEVFSDTVESGYIVSQDPATGRISQNKTMKVNVSKGKGTEVPDFTAMNETEFNEWKTEHSSFTVAFSKTIYTDSDQFILDQSVKKGTMIGTSDGVYLTKNLGNGFYIETAYGSNPVNSSYDKFKDWADNTAADIGLEIDTHRNYVTSNLPKNTIIAITEIKNGNDTYSTVQKLPLEVDITCEVSDGSGIKDETLNPTFTFTKAEKTSLDGDSGNLYSTFASFVDGKDDKIAKIKIIIVDASNTETTIDSIDSAVDKFNFVRFEYKDDNGVTSVYNLSGDSVEVPAGSTMVIKKVN